MNEEYGIKGCVHRLEQRKHLKFSIDGLDKKPNHDSYDVEFSIAGQVLQEITYNYGGTPCRSTKFDYDDAGRLTRTSAIGSTGVEIAVSELAYSKGKCTWVNRDATGTITSRGIDEYDGEHLILLSTFDGRDRPKTVKSFEYLENKLTKSDSRYFLPDGTMCERWLTDYDSQGRVRRTHGLKADGSPLGDGKYLHEYDEEGRIGKVWTFTEFGNDNIASSVTIYEYATDDVGNWIERREFHLWRNDTYQSKGTTTRKLTYYR
jgi:hypothetical protein